MSVMRTGFTAARRAVTAANPAEERRKVRRASSRTNAILLNGIFVQIETKSWRFWKQHISVFNCEDIRSPNKFACRRPLLFRQVWLTDHLLPFAVIHRAASLNVTRQRQ